MYIYSKIFVIWVCNIVNKQFSIISAFVLMLCCIWVENMYNGRKWGRWVRNTHGRLCIGWTGNIIRFFPIDCEAEAAAEARGCVSTE